MLRHFCLSLQTTKLLSSNFSAATRTMSSGKSPKLEAKIKDFQQYLASADRILALCGAGLSASSGLPTFRGAGGMWKTHDAVSLATPQAFQRDPGLVWQFYSYRRHMALHAQPNSAHYALAELAREKPDFITLTQNVDGLSSRANHPPEQLHLLHGNLFDVKCFNTQCDYIEPNNLTDPLVPALAVTSDEPKPSETDRTGAEASLSIADAMGVSSDKSYDGVNSSGTTRPHSSLASRIYALDPSKTNSSTIPESELPHCPKCSSLLRPGVVWFNEALPEATIDYIEDWIATSPKIDLMLVIGTTATVFPAAEYIPRARAKGARVAVVNMESGDLGAVGRLRKGDWMFEGDAGAIVPRLFEQVIGSGKHGAGGGSNE